MQAAHPTPTAEHLAGPLAPSETCVRAAEQGGSLGNPETTGTPAPDSAETPRAGDMLADIIAQLRAEARQQRRAGGLREAIKAQCQARFMLALAAVLEQLFAAIAALVARGAAGAKPGAGAGTGAGDGRQGGGATSGKSEPSGGTGGGASDPHPTSGASGQSGASGPSGQAHDDADDGDDCDDADDADDDADDDDEEEPTGSPDPTHGAGDTAGQDAQDASTQPGDETALPAPSRVWPFDAKTSRSVLTCEAVSPTGRARRRTRRTTRSAGAPHRAEISIKPAKASRDVATHGRDEARARRHTRRRRCEPPRRSASGTNGLRTPYSLRCGNVSASTLGCSVGAVQAEPARSMV